MKNTVFWDVMHVSEEPIATIISVERVCDIETTLSLTSNLLVTCKLLLTLFTAR
jgi:hypothetical protein